MRFWVYIQFHGPDWKDWYWHVVASCQTTEDVGIVVRALRLAGQVVKVHDMLTEGHPIIEIPTGG